MAKEKSKEKVQNVTNYYSTVYPGNYGKEFAKTVKDNKGNEDEKFMYSPIAKSYSNSKGKLDQNEKDAGEQFKEVSKSWKDQDKGFNKVIEASKEIINKRFAKFLNALNTAGISAYKNLDKNPLKESLYKNFCEAGYSADTAHFVVESAFDDSAEEYHNSLNRQAKSIFSLDTKDFMKKIAGIGKQDKIANSLLSGEALAEDKKEEVPASGADLDSEYNQLGKELGIF